MKKININNKIKKHNVKTTAEKQTVRIIEETINLILISFEREKKRKIKVNNYLSLEYILKDSSISVTDILKLKILQDDKLIIEAFDIVLSFYKDELQEIRQFKLNQILND